MRALYHHQFGAVKTLSNKTLRLIILAIAGVFIFSQVVYFLKPASADSLGPIDFESPDFSTGDINGQQGWSKTGGFDVEVTNNTYGLPLGSQTLRISNSVTSGSFGDQTFSSSTNDEAGESDAVNNGLSGGTRQPHFEAQFDFASTMESEQPGLFMSVSPDRGDGARMSYLGFEDTAGGIDVIFYDVQDEFVGFQVANFVSTTVATGLSRTEVHTAKLVMDFVDGPSNDVVGVYIDGLLVHTGTSWENYYRFDTESQGNPHDSSLEDKSRTVDSLLFRVSGTAAPDTDGDGYLIDNVSLVSSNFVDNEVKIRICHATNSETNPYNSIGVALDAIDGDGGNDHSKHTGPVFEPGLKDQKIDWGDIIPPVPGTNPGQNWNEDGIAFWLDNCGDEDGEVQGETCDPTSDWAATVVDNLQGKRKDVSTITGPRAETIHATGSPDAVISPVNNGFYSLGDHGWIELAFNGVIIDGSGDDLTFYEVTSGPYHEEIAKIQVSQNGTDWFDVGTVTNNGGSGGTDTIDISGSGLDWIKYVRMDDLTDLTPANIPSNADGYDIDAVGANVVCPDPEPCDEGQTLVVVPNENQGFDFTCQDPEEPIEPCSVMVFSDTSNTVEEYADANAQALSFVHPGWTAAIPGATWIWSDNPVADAQNETIRNFEKSFYWSGPVTDGGIDIATDNTHKVYLNGNLVGSEIVNGNTFASAVHYDLSPYVQPGLNTLKVEVTNWAWSTTDPTVNPAGLLYKATVTGTDQDCGEPPEITECQILISDTTNTVDGTDDSAVPVTFFHDAWNANIDGAIWIWGDDPVADPVGDTTQTFKKQFNWHGPVASAVLEIAADNSYKVSLNGSEVAADASENNFGAHDTYDLSSGVLEGVNTLEIEVHNWAQGGGTTTSNPAGLLYKFVVQGEEGCEEPEQQQEEVVGSISGVVYDDKNNNEVQDGSDTPLTGWTVWLLTHDSPYKIHAIATTDAGGAFLFEDLAVPGTYYVCQGVQDGWLQTQLNMAGTGGVDASTLVVGDEIPGLDSSIQGDVDDFCYEVVLTEGNPTVTTRDFGNFFAGQLLGDTDTRDPSDDGEVLAATGQAAWLLTVLGTAIIAIALASTRLARKKRATS